MPFTLSHAAAVLPGLRRTGGARGPLVASALVMGSLAPDMTYFAASVVPRAMEFGTFTHGPLGVVTVDAVTTAVLVGLWVLVRDPALALAPVRYRGRLHGWLRGRPERMGPVFALRFYLSAVIGSATHVVWDAFTHADRWGTRLVPVLNETVGGFGGYQIAQYGSSAAALVVLVWFVWPALRRKPVAVPGSVPVLGRGTRRGAFALIGACLVVGAALRLARWLAYHGEVSSPLDIIPTLCFGAGTGLATGVVAYAVWLRVASPAPAGEESAAGGPAVE
ncbi:DUF4184 family protein, partial [Streptomyces sp. NPDC057638]|uniref:DUF4184 family protein n=1 Tax=Streptomyces sp. NPDC057638 TaxID=3346190 RepID=UPI0036B7086A